MRNEKRIRRKLAERCRAGAGRQRSRHGSSGESPVRLRVRRLEHRVETDAGGVAAGEPHSERTERMKQTAMTLTLALGLTALNALAQETNDVPQQADRPPRDQAPRYQRGAPRHERALTGEAGRDARPEGVRPPLAQGEEDDAWAPPGPRRGAAGLGPQGRGPASGPRGLARQGFDETDNLPPLPPRRGGFAGPQGRFGGGPDFLPRDRERGLGPRAMARGFASPRFGFCPCCGRPLGPLGMAARPGFGRRGFGGGEPGPGFGLEAQPGRGFGRDGERPLRRGPGFGRGQGAWLDREGPAVAPQGRGSRWGARADAGDRQPMNAPRDGFRAGRRGPAGPEGRIERDGGASRDDGRVPMHRPADDEGEQAEQPAPPLSSGE